MPKKKKFKTPAPVAYSDKPILTTAQLAEYYGYSVDSIKVNFNRNKSRFEEGKDFFKLSGDALKQLKNLIIENPSVKFQISLHTPILYLWTERGAARHAKILDTDKAWDVFFILEDIYFGNFFQKFNALSEKISNPILNCVYILEMENGTVKIGCTKNFSERAKQISTSSGLKIKNWCHSEYVEKNIAVQIERICHEFFSDTRILGEFFKISFEDARQKLSSHLNISENMYPEDKIN